MDKFYFWSGFMIGTLFISFLWVIVLGHRDDTSRKVEAIKYHHAYYAADTGEFTWKKECVK